MTPNFEKGQGLLPVIAQDVKTKQVLMQAYMNEEAYKVTLESKKLTLWSRSKNRLWTKGETSGNFLNVEALHLDCDQDSILIEVIPEGPACHTGSVSCFGNSTLDFLSSLERTIQQKSQGKDTKSYTKELLERGINKCAQKLGEEAVELVIEAMGDNREDFHNEAADLMYHFLVLLKAYDTDLDAVLSVLKTRSK